MSNAVVQVAEHQIEEERPMSDPLQATPPPFAPGHAVDRTMLDRTILRPSPDVSTGRYYTLNQLGSVIWKHCTGHTAISDIHAVLCDRFEVASERALDDLVALINHLIQEGLLQQERR